MRSTTFADSWYSFCTDHFETMQGNLQNFVAGKLPGMIKYWGSTIASNRFTVAGVQQTLTALNNNVLMVTQTLVINAGFVS
jgi:hypothetical protein